MQVHRLRLINFRQHELTDLQFGRGLTGIIGPNGSGKSTLLEALAWVVYGTKAARGTVASIRRRNAPPRARVEVELEFSLGAHRYRVSRSMHGAELYQDGDQTPIANSPAAVTERLTHVLGMTRDEFFNTYFTGQKELAILGAMTAGERAQFLSRVLGYERLRLAQLRLKDERTSLRARLEELEARLISPVQLAEEEATIARQAAEVGVVAGAARTGFEQAVAHRDAIRPEWVRLQALQERVRSLESDLRVAEQQVTNARDTHAALDRDLAEAVSAQTRIAELAPGLQALPSLQQERDRLDALAAQVAHYREQAGQLGEVKLRLTAMDQKLATLPLPEVVVAARSGLDGARIQLAALEEAAQALHNDWVRDLQDAKTQLKQVTDQYQDLRAQRDRLAEAGADGICPTCGRPLGASVREVMDDLDRQTGELTLNGKFFRSRVKQLEKEPAAVAEARAEQEKARALRDRATADLGRLEGAVQQRKTLEADRLAQAARVKELETQLAEGVGEYDEARHAVVRQQLAALEPSRAEVERLRAIADRAERLTQQATAAESELTRREARITELREELAAAGWAPEAAAAARQAVEEADRSCAATERALVEAEAEIRVVAIRQAEVARRRSERERGEAEAREHGQALQLNQELDRALADLRSDLNDTMRPDLSDLGSRFLRELTTGRYTEFELNEDYVPTIVEDGEPQSVLSGGEEDVVSLALRLAISQMIAERAGQPLSLLILDEVFGSLDDERRGAVIDLLRRLADRFPQVILITHIESVRDGFDQVVRLDFDLERGVAQVRTEGAGQNVAA
ncbi:MAG: SMC family ATPase [Gemmatimonadota bacterium]